MADRSDDRCPLCGHAWRYHRDAATGCIAHIPARSSPGPVPRLCRCIAQPPRELVELSMFLGRPQPRT